MVATPAKKAGPELCYVLRCKLASAAGVELTVHCKSIAVKSETPFDDWYMKVSVGNLSITSKSFR